MYFYSSACTLYVLTPQVYLKRWRRSVSDSTLIFQSVGVPTKLCTLGWYLAVSFWKQIGQSVYLMCMCFPAPKILANQWSRWEFLILGPALASFDSWVHQLRWSVRKHNPRQQRGSNFQSPASHLSQYSDRIKSDALSNLTILLVLLIINVKICNSPCCRLWAFSKESIYPVLNCFY